ncbi:MAG: hypothetical protein ACFCBU_09200 [Cyanophyceae cyanobacterium]
MDYPPAAANTRSLGIDIANQLIGLGIDSAKTQLIGHSLGAHGSGLAGEEYARRTGGDRLNHRFRSRWSPV